MCQIPRLEVSYLMNLAYRQHGPVVAFILKCFCSPMGSSGNVFVSQLLYLRGYHAPDHFLVCLLCAVSNIPALSVFSWPSLILVIACHVLNCVQIINANMDIFSFHTFKHLLLKIISYFPLCAFYLYFFRRLFVVDIGEDVYS